MVTQVEHEAVPPEGVSDDAFLLAYLGQCEAPCPACGYNVHRLREPRCPECGVTLVLRLVSQEGLNRLWVVAMAVAAAGAGMGLFSLSVVLVERWPPLEVGSPEFPRMLGFNIVISYFLLMIPLPALLLWGRRRFATGSQDIKRAAVAALAIATAAAMVTFALLIVWR